MERLLATLAVCFTQLVATSAAQTVTGITAVPPQMRRTPVRAGYSLATVPPLWSQCGLGPVEIDQSVGGAAPGDGTPLSIGGQSFARGFGTHATSVIAYDLDRKAILFWSWVGIDDAVGSSGSAIFEVWADGVQLYVSGLLTGNDGPTHTGRLDVRGVSELLLVVHDGGDGALDDHADWASPFLLAVAPPIGNGSRQRATRGEWESPIAWPIDPMQAALLDSGELLTFASAIANAPGNNLPAAQHDATRADLADTSTFAHVTVDHPSEELFGAALARSSDGTLIAFGGFGGRAASGQPFGQDQSSRFDPATSTWIPAPDAGDTRWGASGLTLGNGFFLAVGGTDAAATVDAPARFDGNAWDTLDGVALGSWLSVGDPALDGTYPFLHLTPDGSVLLAGWDEHMGLFDTRGAGSWSFQGQRESIQRAWGSAASVGAERVLVVGGVDHRGSPGEATRTAVTIDVSAATPVVASTASMLFARADHDATILADGSVFVSGGNRIHSEGAPETDVRVPEIWDPVSGTWTMCAAAVEPRGFRSTAVLLPDGRVWTGGGACGAGCSTGTSAQVFRPPYLFGGSPTGQLAPREVIQSAPASAVYGAAFSIQIASSAPLSRVTLVRAGSATHGVNSDQRFLELPFSQNGSAIGLTAPVDGNVAPPGAYMLFVFDAAGVPSVASIIRFGLATPQAWETLASADGSTLTCRHETAMVTVDGKLYLMGGRGSRPVEEFDPVTQTWKLLGNPPFELHHLQPVVLDGLVHIVGAFTGGFPNETNVPNIWTWDPTTDVWTQGPLIPVARRRGSAGTFVRDGKIYLVGGNNQGHNGGAQPWFDEYDPQTQTWTVLPDAPRARDHFLSVLIGNRLVLAGGRATDLPNVFDGTIPEVDVYDFAAGSWSTLGNDLPTERAGTMAVPVGRYAVIVGGESDAMTLAHDQTEALDVLTDEWVTLPDLVTARHSGGVAVVDGRIYVASGAGNRGGTPELDSLEVLGAREVLDAASTSLVPNGDFDAGLAHWATTGSPLLVPAGGVAAPGVRLQNSALLQTLPATPGNTYTARLFYTSSGTGTATLELTALDAGGATIGSSSTGLPVASELTRAGLTWVAPAGTQSLQLRIATSGGRVAMFDDVVLNL